MIPLGVIAAVGIAAWLVSFVAFDKPAWGIFVANFIFFTSITQGVLGLAIILRYTSAKWSANFFRLATTTAVAFFPIALVMLVVLFALKDSVFFWAAEPVHNPWFNPYFFIGRNAVIFLAFYAVARMLHNYGAEEYESSRIEAIATSEDGGHSSDRGRLLRLGFVFLVLFVAEQTMLAWDFGMIINRHWADSMFAPLFGITSVYGGAAAIVLLMSFARYFLKSINFRDEHFRNMGQLILGLSIFWVYAWYIQFFSIWFANLPEEFEPIYRRIFGGYMGSYVSYVVLMGVFPFFALIFKKVRESVIGVTIVSGAVLIGAWLERYVMTVPALVHEETTVSLPIVHPINILFTLGMFSLFLLMTLNEVRRRREILPETEEELAKEALIADPVGWQ